MRQKEEYISGEESSIVILHTENSSVQNHTRELQHCDGLQDRKGFRQHYICRRQLGAKVHQENQGTTHKQRRNPANASPQETVPTGRGFHQKDN